MTRGGVNNQSKVATVARYSGLILPILLLIYGIMIENGAMDSSNYLGFGWLMAITLSGTTLAVLSFLLWSEKRSALVIILTLFHTYAVGYVLAVSGMNTPFSVAWILLQLVTFYYLGLNAFRISILTFFGTAIVNAFLVLSLNGTLADAFGAMLTGLTMVIVSSGVIQIATYMQDRAPSKPSSAAQPDSVTANQRLQHDRLLTIVNNMADGFFTVNHDGEIQLYNAAALDLLDTNKTLTGVGIQEVLNLTNESDQPIDMIDLLHESRGLTIRDNIIMPDELEKRWIELTYSPVQSNTSNASDKRARNDYIILMRDITKEKSLSEERDEFISVVSHELRTPITVAEGTLSNLQFLADKKDVKPKVLKTNINQAHEQILFLARMVNDLSTLSRAERGVGKEVESIDVRELVDELFNEYSPQAAKHKLTLDLDLSAKLGSVETSRLYLKELLQNFLSNSLKYTHKGGLTLRVKRKADTIRFSVIDTGIGISKTDQKKIFDRFYRSEDYRTRETGGTGLGLYVANKLARKMGSHIELTSRLNYGSEFWFELDASD